MAKIVLFFIFVLAIQRALAQSQHPLFAPVTAGAIVPAFTLTLNSNEEYFVDINAPYFVNNCGTGFFTRPTIPCSTEACRQSVEFRPGPCSPTRNPIIHGQCVCVAPSYDPFSSTCASNQLTRENIVLSSTNPSKQTSSNQVISLCVPPPFVQPGVFGVCGLSWSPLSLWNQLSTLNVGLAKQFALCLPSEPGANNKGIIFFGGGPYLMKSPPNFDVGTILSYVPLLRHKTVVNGYYISLKGISANGETSKLGPTAFEFESKGSGGVLLSTVNPHTTLRSDIYQVILSEFSRATANLPRAENVSPFGLCLRTSGIGSSQTGLNVPRIDFQMTNGKTWSFYGVNTMKKVSNDVACLAFVDGGARATQAVVVGTYQMMNNFLVFDIANSQFGFSTTLSLRGTSCSNFQPLGQTSLRFDREL